MKSIKTIHTGTVLLLLVCSSYLYGQTTPDDRSHFRGPYVELLRGSLPLIISVPHGGYEKPDSIAERTGRYAKSQDIYTIEIALELYAMIHELTGEYPHIIINHLHRTRMDANRSIEEAAGGNHDAEKVWELYQSGIDSLKDNILENYGSGLFIDLHGHRHNKQRIELGYLLGVEELQLDDSDFNSGLLNEYTSIRNLLESSNDSIGPAEIIRGKYSLGTLLHEKGQACLPCNMLPRPDMDDPYFSGGYNTMRHGSLSGGTIDGIQIEIDLATRTNKRKRKEVADDVASALTDFLVLHYQVEK